MKIPEQCSHTIERLIERNMDLYHQKIIDYNKVNEKNLNIIRYGVGNKYIKDIQTGLKIMIHEANLSKRYMKEYRKRIKNEEEFRKCEYKTGPHFAPLISPGARDFLLNILNQNKQKTEKCS